MCGGAGLRRHRSSETSHRVPGSSACGCSPAKATEEIQVREIGPDHFELSVDFTERVSTDSPRPGTESERHAANTPLSPGP